MTNALMKSEFKQNLYNGMLRIRIVEERIAELYSEQEMRCPVHLCTGQEAIAVGASSVLENRDYVFSGHRAHGHYLAKGGDLNRMMSEIYGREGGCARGNGGSMHLIDLSVNFMGATPIVGSTIHRKNEKRKCSFCCVFW
jgi:TPP-dependent pyruvate/acetoin dehydrogenase alpha subunit